MFIEQKHEQPIQVEQFDGPFYILVELLESKQLDITTVSLSEVTQQYLNALEGQHTIDPYTLADFLVIASKLIYLKSKMLLPLLEHDDEEEDIVNLEKQLKIYKVYYNASRNIDACLKQHRIAFAREKLAVHVDVLFNPPISLTVQRMKEVWRDIINRLESVVKVPERIIKRTLSLRDKINHVRDHIMRQLNARFSDLLQHTHDTTEQVITFLAVLELVKQRILDVEQAELHGEIAIRKIGTNT